MKTVWQLYRTKIMQLTSTAYAYGFIVSAVLLIYFYPHNSLGLDAVISLLLAPFIGVAVVLVLICIVVPDTDEVRLSRRNWFVDDDDDDDSDSGLGEEMNRASSGMPQIGGPPFGHDSW